MRESSRFPGWWQRSDVLDIREDDVEGRQAVHCTVHLTLGQAVQLELNLQHPHYHCHLTAWFPANGHSTKNKRTLKGSEKDLPNLHKDLSFAMWKTFF